MGSITRYTIHIQKTLCVITYECEGDFGEVNDGIELQFELDPYLQKTFELSDNRRITWSQLQALTPFVKYKTFLIEYLKEQPK